MYVCYEIKIHIEGMVPFTVYIDIGFANGQKGQKGTNTT